MTLPRSERRALRRFQRKPSGQNALVRCHCICLRPSSDSGSIRLVHASRREDARQLQKRPLFLILLLLLLVVFNPKANSRCRSLSSVLQCRRRRRTRSLGDDTGPAESLRFRHVRRLHGRRRRAVGRRRRSRRKTI